MALGPNQTKWLAALRSGEWKQGKNRLFDGTGYCCLGVAAAVLAHSDDLNRTYPSDALVKDLGLFDSAGSPHDAQGADGEYCLSLLNDKKDKTFAQIADIVEANPAAYFREPR